MDDSNGEFEIVDKKMMTTTTSNSQQDRSRQSLLTNIQPPSELPSFVTSEVNSSSSPAELMVLAGAQPVTVPEPKITRSWQSSTPSSNTGGASTTVLPVTSQPLAPISSSTMTEINSKEASANEKNPSNSNSNWIGWIKGTVQSVGSKVAEKAKSSMDTMITTLDPQMREVLNSGGDIDIIVASDKEVKINPVREAFQNIFGRATVKGMAIQASNVASQLVGFEAVLKSAEERINNIRNSGKIHPQQPIIAVEGFITEFGSETWMELSLLLLDDPYHDIILQSFTQPTPIPAEFVKEAQNQTPSDYPLIGTGYSLTIGQVAAQRFNVDRSIWQETLTEVPRRDTILLAAKTLAGLYKSRLPTDVI